MVNLLQRSWSHVPQSRCSVMEMIDYTSRNGIVQYHQASTQQPAPVHTYSQPNNLSIQREQPGRIGTIPQPAKRVKQYMLQGPSDSLCLPKFPRTMMSQITYELIAFFFPLCPHKFPNAIEVMHNLALQCAQHLDDPNGNNNAMKAIGFTQNGQTIESEALPQLIAEASLDDSAIMDSTDFNAFIWPRKNIFILVYYAKHVNECTATKIDAFLNLLTELERRYDSCQQEVRTFLNDRKFNCLIVGDWKQSRKIFDRLKSGYNAGETHNLMSLYDMNYHFYRVAKTTCISHAAYGIVEKIAEIGQVHKIIYLMDTSYGYGKFDDSWEQLFKRINATIWLVVELQDGENVLERAKQEKQKLANCSTFRGNVEVYTLFTNGQDFLKNYTWDFCTIFSWNYADCINKLVLDISPLSVFEIVGHSEI